MSSPGKRRPARAWIVVASGLLLGLAFWLVDVASRSPGDAATASAPAAPQTGRASSSGSGVYVRADPSAHDARQPAARAPDARRTQPQSLAFSFLGRTQEGGRESIVLYAPGGRTFKVSAPGPLDERYVVDEIREDRVVIRDLVLATQQVVGLDARQYDVPPSLRGEYPPD